MSKVWENKKFEIFELLLRRKCRNEKDNVNTDR